MENNRFAPNAIDPLIIDNAAALMRSAVEVGSSTDLLGMRDQAENALAAAQALVDALHIETQGGRGAAEDGYTPADRPRTLATVRRTLVDIVAARLGWRDEDGTVRSLF